jgi:hypothetical protein
MLKNIHTRRNGRIQIKFQEIGKDRAEQLEEEQTHNHQETRHKEWN